MILQKRIENFLSTQMLLFNNYSAKFFILLFLINVSNLFALQLGDGGEKDTLEFINVEKNAKEVISLANSSFIIKTDDSLWGCGYRIYDFFGMTGNEYVHSYVKLLDNVKHFTGNFLLKADDSLWWCTAQGMKKISENVKKVSQGQDMFCLYITNENQLYGFGSNSHGAFGNGIKKQKHEVPFFLRDNVLDIYTNGLYTEIITDDHTLLITGEHYLPTPYEKSSKFFLLAEDVDYCDEGFYITSSGDLYAFGFAALGALGIGKTQERTLTPTKIMSDVACVVSDQQATLILKKDGALYGCGGNSPNYCGELGFGHKKAVFTPTYILSNVVKISVKNCHSSIIKKDGSVWACGANSLPLNQI